MAVQGATVAVAAGAVTATVTGTFASSYQVGVTPGWLTGYDVVSKTAASFVVNFAVPAPAAGATFDWVASTPATVTSQAITSASVAIAAGVSTATLVLSASLPASYQVTIETNWLTDWDVVTKTATGFTINFAVPAPAGGGTWGYIIYGPAIGTVTLADQLDELRDLLHDPNDRMWSATQKGNYINKAMRRRDVDTAANRSTITFTLTASTATYTFTTVGNGSIIDVIAIYLQFGQTRVLLDNPSLSVLNTHYRQSVNLTGWTRGWARQGPSTVLFGPTPATAYVTEWDAVVYGNPLVALTDTDPLPYPYTQPVPYYAAYLAKINERESDEKNEFFDAYRDLIELATNGRAPQIPMAYSGMRRG